MAILSALSSHDRRRWARNGLVAAAVNLVSHTVFWYVQGHGLLMAEVAVVLAEGACYAALCKLPWRRALAWAALLNLASYLLGARLWPSLIG